MKKKTGLLKILSSLLIAYTGATLIHPPIVFALSIAPPSQFDIMIWILTLIIGLIFCILILLIIINAIILLVKRKDLVERRIISKRILRYFIFIAINYLIALFTHPILLHTLTFLLGVDHSFFQPRY